MSGFIEIVEVGPRDGLQNERAALEPAAKVDFIRRLEACGARRVEAVSFVNERRVPQMAGAEAIMAELPHAEGRSRIGLVLNERGWDRAVAAKVDEANVVVCVTDGFGIRNQGAPVTAQMEALATIAHRQRAEGGPPISVTFSVAFGCPFDGEVTDDQVAALARDAGALGVAEIALGDTIGVADPWTVRRRIEAVRKAAPDARLRMHFHDTRNTGLANAFASIEAGVTVLDASCGGLGGCPFAPAATGNIATEDLVYMLTRAGYDTGYDLGGLIEAGRWIGERIGKPPVSALSRAGGFPGPMKGGDGLFPLRLAWVIPVAGVATLALGIWGWLAHGFAIDDAVYRALALFDINNDAYASGVGLSDLRFRIGRWTGAAVVFSSLLALAALLHEHVATAIARWTKQQVVVVGAHPLALAGFEAARRAGRSALWLGAGAFSASRLSAIALQWPPDERGRAVFEHARRADHVLIADVDDAEALALARQARAAAPGAWITVLMSDRALAEDAAATLSDARTRILAAGAVAARALSLAHPPFLIARELGHPRIHALILGFGQTGQAIARDLMLNARTTYLAAPRITVIDPSAKALEGAFRVRAPELDACAEFGFIDGEVSGRAVRPGPDAITIDLAAAGPITVAYVCLADDAAALSAAATLQALLRSQDIAAPPIFVQLRGAGAIGAGVRATGAGAGAGLDALIPFGDLHAVLTASEFLSDAPDAVARAFSEAYRANLSPEVRGDPANRSARPWDQTDETYRQATRDAVAHIPAKLASAGADPSGWRGVAGLPRLGPDERLFENNAELEALAELEHERWNVQRRLDGWRGTAGRRDDARRLHPSLAPYAALSDEVKAFDRVFIRETEAACRAAVAGKP